MSEFFGFDGRVSRLGYLWRTIVVAGGIGALAAISIWALTNVLLPDGLTGPVGLQRDVITGASNVSNAMGGGKLAARQIDERLMGEKRWERLFPQFDYNRAAPGEPSLSRRHSATVLPAKQRAHSQDEVVGVLTAQEALEECRRCLRCDLRVPANGE